MKSVGDTKSSCRRLRFLGRTRARRCLLTLCNNTLSLISRPSPSLPRGLPNWPTTNCLAKTRLYHPGISRALIPMSPCRGRVLARKPTRDDAGRAPTAAPTSGPVPRPPTTAPVPAHVSLPRGAPHRAPFPRRRIRQHQAQPGLGISQYRERGVAVCLPLWYYRGGGGTYFSQKPF